MLINDMLHTQFCDTPRNRQFQQINKHATWRFFSNSFLPHGTIAKTVTPIGRSAKQSQQMQQMWLWVVFVGLGRSVIPTHFLAKDNQKVPCGHTTDAYGCIWVHGIQGGCTRIHMEEHACIWVYSVCSFTFYIVLFIIMQIEGTVHLPMQLVEKYSGHIARDLSRFDVLSALQCCVQ